MNDQKGFINILVVIVVIAVVGVAGYYFVSKQATEPPTTTTDNDQGVGTNNVNTLPTQSQGNNMGTPAPTPAGTKQTVTATAYTGTLKTYKNSKYGFEVKYPANLIVTEGKIEPNTYFVVWKNPSYNNTKVNIIYINEGKAALTSTELSKGTQTKIGTRSGYQFTSNANPLYWVDVGTYALAIYFEKPQSAGSNYNEYLQISTFKF